MAAEEPAEVWTIEVRHGTHVVMSAEVPAGWAGQVISRTQERVEKASLATLLATFVQEEKKEVILVLH